MYYLDLVYILGWYNRNNLHHVSEKEFDLEFAKYVDEHSIDKKDSIKLLKDFKIYLENLYEEEPFINSCIS